MRHIFSDYSKVGWKIISFSIKIFVLNFSMHGLALSLEVQEARFKSGTKSVFSGIEHRVYEGDFPYFEVRGGIMSGRKTKVAENLICVPESLNSICKIDLQRSRSHSTPEGAEFGSAGSGFGIFIKTVNDHELGSAKYYLNANQVTELEHLSFVNGLPVMKLKKQICLYSKVKVSSHNRRRGWYEDRQEIYLKCNQKDRDGDSVFELHDNCPLVYNPDQLDSDGDRLGNACDNCPTTRNPLQYDNNENGVGNACETDKDNDGVDNEFDNCPNIPNPGQENSDTDIRGDACDNCIHVNNQNQIDTDGDKKGNVCDVDDDGDSIDDVFDNCPLNYNPDQSDSDLDEIGDSCDQIDGNAKPNLLISKVSVKVGGVTSSTPSTLKFKYNQQHEFSITVKNDAAAIAESVDILMAVSASPSAYDNPSSASVYSLLWGSTGVIQANSIRVISMSTFIGSSILHLNLVAGKTYYMFVDLNTRGRLDETSTKDNLLIIPFKVDGSSGKAIKDISLSFPDDDR